MSRGPGHFYIDETCIGCGACEHACPGKVDAIYKVSTDFLGRFAIILDDCIDCSLCLPTCPVDCIHDARTEGIVEGSGGNTQIRALQAWAEQRQTPDKPWLKKPTPEPTSGTAHDPATSR